MAFSSSSSSLSATPNVTPLIDVLLVLLIIFMVVVPLTPHGLESLLPETSSNIPQRAQPEPLVLRIAKAPNGVHALTYRLNGVTLDLPQLRVALRDAQAQSVQRSILVAGDPALDYGPVANLVSEAHHVGFNSIGLLPRDPAVQQ